MTSYLECAVRRLHRLAKRNLSRLNAGHDEGKSPSRVVCRRCAQILLFWREINYSQSHGRIGHAFLNRRRRIKMVIMIAARAIYAEIKASKARITGEERDIGAMNFSIIFLI